MRKTTFTRLLSLVLVLLIAAGTVASLSGCSDRSGKVLLQSGNQTISTNAFQLMLSRVKGNLSRSGYNVQSDSFWDTVIESDGTVYNDFILQQTLYSAKQLLAAAVIFEEEGLSLSQETLDSIEADIQEHINTDTDGSKSAFNSLLSAYGANITALRELYTLEAKASAVKGYLYGSNASKVAATVKQEFLDENAVCFKQILIRNYYEKYEKDTNGDDIYYLTDENNARVNNIAYDTKNGIPRVDDKGEIIKDANKEMVYFLDDGRIAYDKEKGVRAPLYDQNGRVQTGEYTAEEKAAHLEQAQEILGSIKAGNYTAFESMISECMASGDDAVLADNEFCFLYTTGDNDDDYLNDIADALDLLDEGEVYLLSSEYGYSVLMKYPMVADAYADEAYAAWFGDFNARLTSYLFKIKCTSYIEAVTVDAEEFAALPSMKELGINYYY